jgi:hypothetical protein
MMASGSPSVLIGASVLTGGSIRLWPLSATFANCGRGPMPDRPVRKPSTSAPVSRAQTRTARPGWTAKMPREQSPRRSIWLTAHQSTQYALVTCPPRSLYGHWDASARRMRRCGRDLCALCAMDWQPRQFWYIGLCTLDGERLVMELREAQDEVRRKLADMAWDCVGVQLAIYKDGPAKNSPVRVDIVGREQCEANDVAALVAQLGLPPRYSEPIGGPADPPEGMRDAVPGGSSKERRRPRWQ